MKYIMFEDFAGKPLPIIIPRRIDFLEFREQIPYARVLSAGYVVIEDEQFVCMGESKGLGAASRPEDAELIRKSFEPKGEDS